MLNALTVVHSRRLVTRGVLDTQSFDFGRFVKHVQRDGKHPLVLTATGFCKFDTLLRYYEEFFHTVTLPAFRKEHATWFERYSQHDQGNGPVPGSEPMSPTADELDDIFLKTFKIFKSAHYEDDREIVVVNGFCLRAHQQVSDLSELD